ncbi:MAG: aldolase/citrate lyase family protein [Actinomycetota bacterium]|nr:aldolase/citrate lyase family protein [Actinomycetota bacterium]
MVFNKDFFDAADKTLAQADRLLADKYRGDFGGRQPIHTCYVPADKLSPTTPADWGASALQVIDNHTPTARSFAKAIGAQESAVEEIFERIKEKLKVQPIEDLRIDFEDGYGRRGDEEEDRDLQSTLESLQFLNLPFIGIRMKAMEQVTRERGLKTLNLFVAGLCAQGKYPENFIITLPKVTFPEQVDVMVSACQLLEKQHSLAARIIRFEIQIETTQAIMDQEGRVTAAQYIERADGRLTGFHYGTYDYSAAAGISSAYQTLDHPAAEYAKSVLQVATAGTTVRVSDGSTNILPVGTVQEVHAAMHNHYRLVRRALERGIYQGWDLHGSQIPTRIAANWIFYRDGLAAASKRIKNYLQGASSGIMDEPATALTLARYFLRGLDCGAIQSQEIEKLTGVDEQALRTIVINKGII